MTIDFVRYRMWFYALSIITILPGIVSLVLPGGLRPGIDFTSGTIMSLRFQNDVDQARVREAFAGLGHSEAIVQRADDGTYVIRTLPFEGSLPESADAAGQTERQVIVNALTEQFGPVEVLSLDVVSPIIANEIVRYAVLAVFASCGGILLYLWWAFRRVPNSIRYGACAVFALLHDALLVLGIFSILGRFFAVELDAMFITAVLTIIGFSVHDTIVVFDRVRENIVRHAGEPFDDVMNHSLTQTIGRSVNTSITVLLTLVALRLFGGTTTHNFVLALLIGITSGTYSSIFNASLLLYSWNVGELQRWFSFGRRQSAETAAASA
jgi:preprotein translocase subunit SecF